MLALTSAWCDDDGLVHLASREPGEPSRVRTVKGKWSLFMADLDDQDRAALGRDRRVVGVSVDRDMTRIDCRNRWARKEVVEILEQAASRRGVKFDVREADVSPVRRLLSDNPAFSVSATPRLVFIDLETDNRKTFDQMKKGDARILSWALVGDGIDLVECLPEDSDSGERYLIACLFTKLADYDVVLAWNGDGFDFPVLHNRAAKLGVQTGPLHQWCWLDHLEVFRKYNQHSDDGGEAKTSFKLDHVAHYLLGEGKVDFDASKAWEAWRAGGEERERLARYNLHDARLLSRIEQKTGFIALHLAACAICHVFPDTESLNATVQGDGFLLRLGAERGYRFPTKRQYDADFMPEKFAGAFVMEPTRTGAVDNVHVADFVGLYPSIMRTFNMSVDTKVTGERLAPEIPTCQLPGRTTRFRLDHDGIFRVALDRLVAQRAEYTDAMKRETPGSDEHAKYKRLSGAFKIVANSFYGIVGSPWSRFFDREIAEGVTQTGRYLLERTIKEAKLAGFDPFYADTDSLYVQGDAAQFAAFVESMNAKWTGIMASMGAKDRHHIDLDFEKSFRRILMVSAKRYAASYATYKGKAADPSTKPEVKGLEFKRGDAVKVARDMQSEAVAMLLQPELPAAAAMREFVDRWRGRILHDPLTLDCIVLSQSLSKPLTEYADPGPMHVQVARLMKQRGEQIGEGARVRYVIAQADKKAVPIPASDPDALARVDRLYYWEHRIYPPTERLLECCYPDGQWGESRALKRQRAMEQAGQGDLFQGPAPAPRAPSAAPERPPLVVGMDGNGDAVKRRLLALRAAIELEPGETPVVVALQLGEGVVARVPTGMGVGSNVAAKRAIARAVGKDGQVAWPSALPLDNRIRRTKRHDTSPKAEPGPE